MVEKVVGIKAAKTNSAVATALKAGLFLFFLTRVAGGVFGGWWGAISRPVVRSLLQTAQLPNIEATIDRIFIQSMGPLTMAVLTVLAPLFGWWIYSRVEKSRQDAVGWLAALIFAACDAALSLLVAGLQSADLGVLLFLLAVGETMMILWIMFFMGVGFNIAKLLKSPL